MRLFSRVFKGPPFNSNTSGIRGHVDEVLVELDNIIERLNIEEEHSPLKILGVKATYGFLNSIYATLITVAAAVGQKSVGI